MSSLVPESAPRPRLCHLRKWPDFNGYGFNLHAEKGKAGQFIGKIDEGSPAEACNLKEGDRIVEVNGTNIGNENHQQVVTRIKAVPDETKLFVVDRETDDYYKEKKIVVRGDMPNVLVYTCPATRGEADVSTTAAQTPEETTPNQTPSEPEPQAVAPAAPVAEEVDTSRYHPRLCHIKIWPDFQGYGFNLHAEKGKPGQYIGKVDDGSPADAGGLREGDRIVEVNGNPVSAESHGTVVQYIKSNPGEAQLLVVDTETDNQYKSRGVEITGSLPEVETITCPDSSSEGRSTPSTAPVSPTPSATENNASYSARLSVLRIWPDFQGYGFNMHAEKGKPGQYIGKVDDGSPAEAAGLREGDRIIEVNGINVEQDNHQSVVQKIKSVPNETRLLVVDTEADNYFKGKAIVISNSSPFVNTIEAPNKSADVPAPVAAPSSQPESYDYSARLSVLRIWPDFQGYGFNMHAEKGKPGQYIGKVDDGSPAEAAGLREGDRIIEVNGINVEQDNHQSVVQKIKSVPNETRLLVVDTEADNYFKGKGVVIASGASFVNTIECQDRTVTVNGDANGEVNYKAQDDPEPAVTEVAEPEVNHVNEASEPEEVAKPVEPVVEPVVEQVEKVEEPKVEEPKVEQPKVEEPAPAQSEPSSTKQEEDISGDTEAEDIAASIVATAIEVERQDREEEYVEESVHVNEVEQRYEPEPEEDEYPQNNNELKDEEPAVIAEPPVEIAAKSEPTPAPEPSKPTTPVVIDGIEFAATAKEARERMSRKKKNDPRQSQISMKDKYDLFQRL